MKGIILAGGRATRLMPLTKITSKQLLPVYNKPMIYYPLETLINAGIKEILIIVAPEYSGHFVSLLGDGSEFGIKLSYAIQPSPRGLADAFIIGEGFINKDNVTMILGDNIFDEDFSEEIKSFDGGAMIFVKEVTNPEKFGVVKFDRNLTPILIVEKPTERISDYAVTGLYIFDNNVSNISKKIKPSERGELEIVSVINEYLDKKELNIKFVRGIWEDAGSFDGLLNVGNYMKEKNE